MFEEYESVPKYNEIFDMAARAIDDLGQRYEKTKGAKTRAGYRDRLRYWITSLIGAYAMLERYDVNREEELDGIMKTLCERTRS